MSRGVSIFSLNTFLIPFRNLNYSPTAEDPNQSGIKLRNLRTRAAVLAEYILSKNADVLLLQEVWQPPTAVQGCALVATCGYAYVAMGARAVVLDILQGAYPYHTDVEGGSLSLLDSGLVVLSKFPIERTKFMKYLDTAGDVGKLRLVVRACWL